MIVVMSKQFCPNCDKLKAELDKKNVNYKVIDLGEKREYLETLMNDGLRSVPQVYREDGENLTHVGDFTYAMENAGSL